VSSTDRRRLGRLLGLALIVACANPSLAKTEEPVAGVEAASAWSPLEPPDGSFRVSVPGEPSFRQSSRPTAVGAVRDSIWRFVLGTVELAVELHELPHLGTLLMSDDLILASVASSVVDDVKGNLLSENRELRAGRPARRLTYEISGAAARLEEALIVLDRARVYVLTATRGRDAPRPAAFDRFFTSFELPGAGGGE
jgi:hypothetical protein